jgi:DNA-binding response OmpR family regulator
MLELPLLDRIVVASCVGTATATLAAPTLAAPQCRRPPRPPAAPARILVADDDRDACGLIAAVLAHAGYDSVQVFDGESALAAMSTRGADLAILDVMMPGCDGWTVCRHIRQDPRRRAIPVILLTGLTRLDDELQALANGADIYLPKPTSRDDLLAAVRSVL